MTDNFSGQFCRHFKIPAGHYRAAVLNRTLYPPARWLRPVLSLIDRNYFSVENDYIDGVGRIHRARELTNESHEFSHHPVNRRFLRRTLRLRVSVGRMRTLVNHVMRATGPTSE